VKTPLKTQTARRGGGGGRRRVGGGRRTPEEPSPSTSQKPKMLAQFVKNVSNSIEKSKGQLLKKKVQEVIQIDSDTESEAETEVSVKIVTPVVNKK
jgi:hypothetical protein